MHKGHYIWNAEDYADHSTAQFTWAREMIGKLNLRGSESVLDIGCGDGKVTALIASSLTGGSVTGMDSSASMIALAQKRFPSSLYPNLSFVQADASMLSFTDQFELAFSNAALHWIPDQASVLLGVRAALKSSGGSSSRWVARGMPKMSSIQPTDASGRGDGDPIFPAFRSPYVFFPLKNTKSFSGRQVSSQLVWS